MFNKNLKLIIAGLIIAYAVYQFIEGNIGNGIFLILLSLIFIFLYFVLESKLISVVLNWWCCASAARTACAGALVLLAAPLVMHWCCCTSAAALVLLRRWLHWCWCLGAARSTNATALAPALRVAPAQQHQCGSTGAATPVQ